MTNCEGIDEDEELRGFAQKKDCVVSMKTRNSAAWMLDEELQGFAEDEELRGVAEDQDMEGVDGYVRRGWHERTGKASLVLPGASADTLARGASSGGGSMETTMVSRVTRFAIQLG